MLQIRIKDYKLLGNVEAEFVPGNLYFITGGNKRGKTSFSQAVIACLNALNKTPDPVQWGKPEAEVVTEFTGADGLQYVARFSVEKDKDEKFVLTLPDGKKERKVTDIRKIIGYNQITVDEWFRLGLTAEGRRKQADYLLELIPETDKAAIADIDNKINAKTGKLYLDRQAKNKELEASRGVLERLAISAEEIKSLSSLETYKTGLQKLENELAQANEHNAKISSLITIQEQQEQNKARLSKEITDTQSEIKRLQERLVNLISEYDQIHSKPTEEVKPIPIDELTQRVQKGKDMIKSLELIAEKQKTLQDESARAKQLVEEVETLDEQIKDFRAMRQDIIAKANLGDNIAIDSEGCWYKEGDNLLPFNEESICYSDGGIAVTKIILEKNKHLPLVFLGKAAEYDPTNMKKLQQLAQQYNGIIVADTVTEGEFEIQIYQEHGE